MRGQLATVKTKWIIAGLGLAIGGAWFSYDYSQCPTIRFVGWRPLKEEPDLILPNFEIRNNTRHAFSIIGDARSFRISTASGFREEERRSMNCTGIRYFTIYPGQSFQSPEFAVPVEVGQRFAVGIRFYRGTSESVSAPRSIVTETISHLIGRWISPTLLSPRITWSDLAEPPP